MSRIPGLRCRIHAPENCTKKRAATLIDKLDIGVPRGVRFTKSFAKLIEISHSPEWHNRVWRDGGHYEKRGDFRAISNGEYPIILHHMNKHDRKAGDKLELIETAQFSVSELKGIQEEVFRIDADGNRVMRLDLASDIFGTPVRWFTDYTEFRYKQVHRSWSQVSISARQAETLLAGQKPNQIRIYDKTGHRKVLLQSEMRRMTRDERMSVLLGDAKGFAHLFETRWGYPMENVVTRVERQIGGAAPKRMGLELVQNLHKLPFMDPFSQIVLPADIRIHGPLRLKTPAEWIMVEALRSMALKHGVVHAKNYLHSRCTSRTQYYRIWKNVKPHIMPVESETITRKDLLESFRATLNTQLAA